MPFLDLGTCRRPSVFDGLGHCHSITARMGSNQSDQSACRLSGHDWETSGFAPIVLKLWKLAIRIVEDLRKPAHCVRTDQKSEFYGFDADRDFSAALNILHRGLGMSLKPGGNAPARRENENDRVVLTLPTA